MLSSISPCCFPCASAHLTPQEVSSGSKSGKKLTHKYKVNRFLSSLNNSLRGFMSTSTDAEVGLRLATCWWPWVETSALLQPETWLGSYMATIKLLHLMILTQQNGSLWRHTRQRHLGQLQTSNKPSWNQKKTKAIFSHFSPLSKQVSDPPRAPAPLQLYKTEPNTQHAVVEQAHSH